MKEYKINENTTYIDDGNTNIIKYAKQDGSSLVVSFRACDLFTTGGDDDHMGFPDSVVKAEIYIEKPVKCEEKQTEEKKLSKFEQVKNRLLQKFLSKKEDKKEKNKAAPKETFSKEVLFSKKLPRRQMFLEDFLAEPIKLEPEYNSVLKVLESARQTIITDGYRLKEEATKVYLEQWEAQKAKEKKAASDQALVEENNAARKLKDFGIGR